MSEEYRKIDYATFFAEPTLPSGAKTWDCSWDVAKSSFNFTHKWGYIITANILRYFVIVLSAIVTGVFQAVINWLWYPSMRFIQVLVDAVQPFVTEIYQVFIGQTAEELGSGMLGNINLSVQKA